MNSPTLPPYGPVNQQVDLERETFEAMQVLAADHVLRQVEVNKYYDVARERSVQRLTYHVFGQRLDEQVVEHPSDWWQHFKHRWFPAWALRRWPVVLAKHTMKLMGFYPELLGRDRYLHIMIQPSTARKW